MVEVRGQEDHSMARNEIPGRKIRVRMKQIMEERKDGDSPEVEVSVIWGKDDGQ